MIKKKTNWEIWLYILLYFVFLGGLLYLMKFVTALPYIVIFVFTLLSYLIYKGKLTLISRADASSAISSLWLLILVAGVTIFATPHRYKSYIGKYIVPGKMITRTVTVEADEGPSAWQERRTYWQPRTKTGNTVMSLIGWANIGFVIGSFYLCLRYYSKAKEKERNIEDQLS